MLFPPVVPINNNLICWNCQDCSLPDIDTLRYDRWIIAEANSENKTIGEIQIIFCQDSFLSQINKDYLKHNTLTDIITFQYEEHPIQAEIYISLERVKENAESMQTDYLSELSRVIIHGVLHCCGYSDKTEKDQLKMRERENIAMKHLLEK